MLFIFSPLFLSMYQISSANKKYLLESCIISYLFSKSIKPYTLGDLILPAAIEMSEIVHKRKV